LSGLVGKLQRVAENTCFAGWNDDISQILAWFRSKNIVENAMPYSPPDLPSWSWLTRFRPLRTMKIREDADKDKRLELLSWSVKLADENALFGRTEGVELEILRCVIQTTGW